MKTVAVGECLAGFKLLQKNSQTQIFIVAEFLRVGFNWLLIIAFGKFMVLIFEI